MDKKEQKNALTIDKQIENLKNLGLLISNVDKAKEILSNISYYRLVKAYSLEFKKKNSNYLTGTKFETVVELYYFNSELCQIIFTMVEKIEILLRCRIGNYFSIKYGVLGYENSKNFENKYYYDEFKNDIDYELERNDKSPIVKNFKNNYIDGKLPFYALIELFSFGTLSKFYKNMISKDKKEIAKTFGISYTYLESWIESIAFVRNTCAHYGRVYNEKIPKKPMLYKEDKNDDNEKLFIIVKCMSRIIKHDKEWDAFKIKLESLFKKYKNVNISSIGFPDKWKTSI